MTKENKKKKVANDKKPVGNVRLEFLPEDSYQTQNIIFDFSFKASFQSMKHGGFNNFLKDEKDYIAQFRLLMKNVTHLSGHTMAKLLNSNEFRHCHALKKDAENVARKVTEKLFEENQIPSYEQEIGDETLYQLGCQDGTRFVGTVNGNVFRVYFVDYFHSLDPDERRNERNLRNYKFCPMTSEIE